MFSLRLSDDSQSADFPLPQSVDELRSLAKVFAGNQSHRLVFQGKAIADSFDIKAIEEHQTVYVVKSNSEKTCVYKINFNGEWRRFRAPASLSFAEFVAHLQSEVSSQIHAELKYSYVDCDGDEITIGSQIEWLEAKREFGDDRAIKINIGKGRNHGKYFKDGHAQVVGVRRGLQGKVVAPSEPRATNATVALVASLFPNNKILPHNVPAFLQPAVRTLVRGDADAELDFDLATLQAVLQQRVLALFDKREFAAAKQLLAAMIDAASAENGFNASWCWYNLACAHSLQGDVSEALTALHAAVESGFTKLTLLISDQDFAAVKQKEPHRFQQIVNVLVDKVAAAPAPPQ